MKQKVAAFIASIILLGCSGNDKIGYADLQVLFSGFEMKKELELELQAVKSERQKILDTLAFSLKVLEGEIHHSKEKTEKVAKYRVLVQDFQEKLKFFEEDNFKMAKQYDEQIFAQMNQYVKDFGKKNSYKAILGAEGSGVLMYADSASNITSELENYINERYRGAGK